MSIKAIDKTSIHRITSGQVVIDLQTAVKELVENSLDAGATAIEVRFKQYGLTSVEVIDNGSGIPEDNYDGLALKHHTSKLAKFEDLTTVTTFGFRGEALSSLCALCEGVTVVTATQPPMGVSLEMQSSGKVGKRGKVARQRGTTITLTNLFTPLPVRRKEFERNAKREFGKALTLLNAYALGPCSSASGVRLTVSNQPDKGQKSVQIRTSGTPSLRANVSALWGPKALDNVVDLNLDFSFEREKLAVRRTSDSGSNQPIRATIRGLVSKFAVGSGRTGTDRQFFYVNSRPCNLSKIQKSFNEVYRSFNATQSPFIVADLILPTDSCDINVSPDKRSILMHHEGNLVSSLKTALESAFAPGRATYDVEGANTPGAQKQSKLVLPEATMRKGKSASRNGGDEDEDELRDENSDEHGDGDGDAETSPPPAARKPKTLTQSSILAFSASTRASKIRGEGDGEGVGVEMSASSAQTKTNTHKTTATTLTQQTTTTLLGSFSHSRKDMGRSRQDLDDAGEEGEEADGNSGVGGVGGGEEDVEMSPPLPPPAPVKPTSKSKSNLPTVEMAPPVQPAHPRDGPSPFLKPIGFVGDSGGIVSISDPPVLGGSGPDDEEEEGEPPMPMEDVVVCLDDSRKSWLAPNPDEGDAEEAPVRRKRRSEVGLTVEGDEEDQERGESEDPDARMRKKQKRRSESKPPLEVEVEVDAGKGKGKGKGKAETARANLRAKLVGFSSGGSQRPAAVQDQDPDEERDELEEEDELEESFLTSTAEEGNTQMVVDPPQDDDAEIMVIDQPSSSPQKIIDLTDLDDDIFDRDFDTSELSLVTTAASAPPPLDANDEAVSRPEVLRTGSSDGDRDVSLRMDVDKIAGSWERFASCRDLAAASKDKGKVSRGAGIDEDEDEQAAIEALARTISKADFGGMDIVGQFNLGFIIVRRRDDDSMDDLFIVDQHAADEKYNFETLQQTTRIRSQRLFRPQPLELTAGDELLALENLDLLRQNGFEVSATTADDDEGGSSHLSLTAQPISKSTVFDMKDLEELIHLMHDRPAGEMVRCSKARAMFASRACRKSVMVGMPLNRSQMTAVVRHMGTMDQPWNCPHGRPTMRHLSDLTTAFVAPERAVDWGKFA